MLMLSSRHQVLIGLSLLLLMVSTRGHHFATLEHLPGASWAVFLLAGLYLRPMWVFPALLVLAGSLDYVAITWGGVPNFCASPAYPMLLPAYGSLWLAGRWYAKRYNARWSTFVPASLAVLLGATVCELFSSGGFYFLSGHFSDRTLFEFGARFIQYFPGSLQSLLFYVAIAAVIHLLLVSIHNIVMKQNRTEG